MIMQDLEEEQLLRRPDVPRDEYHPAFATGMPGIRQNAKVKISALRQLLMFPSEQGLRYASYSFHGRFLPILFPP